MRILKFLPGEEGELRAEAESLEDLVSFGLGKVLSASDAKEIFFKKLEVVRLERNGKSWVLDAQASGEPYSPEKGEEHVKAVTHHETAVEEKDGKWRIRILLDI